MRATVLESPRTYLTATGGGHRYTSAEVPEGAPFIGLGVRQTWAVLNHLEVGWELKARRVSAYEKERYFPLLMEMRETIEEREYLLALALSLGGVF